MSHMSNKEFNRFKKACLYSVSIHQKLKDGTFIHDKKLMAELMDDSKITGGGCPKQKPLIGENYQVNIPNSGHKYNLRNRK